MLSELLLQRYNGIKLTAHSRIPGFADSTKGKETEVKNELVGTDPPSAPQPGLSLIPLVGYLFIIPFYYILVGLPGEYCPVGMGQNV